MSVIHINQIQNKISDLFRGHLNLSDIGANDKQREEKILSRCLAAYAVLSTVECSPEEAAQSVVDGGDDNGIDAIYYSLQNKQMIIVQSKFSKDGKGEPDSAGVAKFCNGVKALFNLDFDRFNDKVKSRRDNVERALRDYDFRYILVLIDTHAAKELAVHSTRLIDDLLREMNDNGEDGSDPVVKFIRLNQSKVHSSLALSAGSEPINIELGLTQWGTVSEPYKAFYGQVSGNEIAEWWKNYNNRLFVRNIRQVLGSTDVNEEIERTLKSNPNLFWYFNNGITIIADKIEKSVVGGSSRDLGSFKLTTIAIVNGAQTVSTIGKYLIANPNSRNLEDVKVAVRMIQLSDTPENFGKDVTKANNRQNRIENRDFVSQDEEQLRIKTELAIDGIDYNIMRSESYAQSDKSFELSEATVALACASGKTSLAVQVKGGIGKFYEDLEKGIYKEIFNRSVSGYYVFNCVKVVRFIESVLKNKLENLSKHSGREYGVLVHGNRILELMVISQIDMKYDLNKINFSLDEERIKGEIDVILIEIITYLQENFAESFLATLFKNNTKCSEMVIQIEEKLNIR